MKVVRYQSRLLHIALTGIFFLFTYAQESNAQSVDYQNCADLVIFSYHRPMQLYALCESLQKYGAEGLGSITVIYRADTDEYRAAYAAVCAEFPHIVYMPQGTDPYSDFKPLTLQATFNSPCPYVLFAVDDIIVTGPLSLANAIHALRTTGAYGFYFRLGTNLTACYTVGCEQPLPRLHALGDTMLAWQLGGGQYDWGYPNSVDMTLYRKADIENALRTLSYNGPNQLEGYWAQQGHSKAYALGLCYMKSKIVNIPYNKVQNVWDNRHMNILSTDELLQLFMQGKKIAIDDFADMDNRAAHVEYSFRFIDR